jgi:hypothetical protein
MVSTSHAKLRQELRAAGPELAARRCVDDWTVRDLMAVRVWWTEQVIRWIEAGRRGERLVLPAPGYGWRETPRLNAAIVAGSRGQSFRSLCGRLDRGVVRVLAVIDSLDDRELLEPGVFGWAGKWPLARWISINTARQYTTARAYVRRLAREHGTGG